MRGRIVCDSLSGVVLTSGLLSSPVIRVSPPGLMKLSGMEFMISVLLLEDLSLGS